MCDLRPYGKLAPQSWGPWSSKSQVVVIGRVSKPSSRKAVNNQTSSGTPRNRGPEGKTCTQDSSERYSAAPNTPGRWEPLHRDHQLLFPCVFPSSSSSTWERAWQGGEDEVPKEKLASLGLKQNHRKCETLKRKSLNQWAHTHKKNMAY